MYTINNVFDILKHHEQIISMQKHVLARYLSKQMHCTCTFLKQIYNVYNK